MSHTKGPWKYEPETRTSYDSTTGEKRVTRDHWITSENNYVTLCTSCDVAEANARLIAAAPEMYSALFQVAKLLSYPEMRKRDQDTVQLTMHAVTIKKILDAIAKAEGSSK